LLRGFGCVGLGESERTGDSFIALEKLPDFFWYFLMQADRRTLHSPISALRFNEDTLRGRGPRSGWHLFANGNARSRHLRHGEVSRDMTMADTSLLKKLGIKSKQSLTILNAPKGYTEQISALLPAEVKLVTSLSQTSNFDIVVQFVNNKAEVEQDTPKAIEQVKPGGRLWIAYPKQSSKVPTDVNRDILWKIFPNSDWRPVTQISIDEIWSALRFRPKSEVGS
jgi:hypothetical protein